MSQAVTVGRTNTRLEMKTDSLASGLSFLFFANVLQRGIGFLRNLGFCYFLSEQQLGLWALASSFFVLAAPLAVLGLPGSLGRFVETYRLRNQLASYVRRIVMGSIVGGIGLCLSIVVFYPLASRTVFGEAQALSTMALVSFTLLTVIVFNFLNELVSGLRQARVASSMQMVNSLSFTLLSILWLNISSDWRGVMVSFAIASLLGIIPAWQGLKLRCLEAFQDQQPLSWRVMWQRVFPFAASVWIMNLLSNLFDVVDRYMLLHLSSANAELGQSVVGQFHSGRVLPVLLTSLGLMINGMLLPYMSADWEAGRIDRVRSSLRSTFAMMTFAFWALSLAGLAVAPWIFYYLLDGRYADGLAIMPAAMVHCIFAALAMLLHNYLWCAERGRTIAVLVGFGLLLNIVLNYFWVPMYGVSGAMYATLIAGGAILLVTGGLLTQAQCGIGWRSVLIASLPLSLLISVPFSVVCFGVAVLAIFRTEWILFANDKRSFENLLQPFWKRIGLGEPTLWRF